MKNRNYKRWTADEDAIVLSHREQGITARVTGSLINRSKSSVAQRRDVLINGTKRSRYNASYMAAQDRKRDKASASTHKGHKRRWTHEEDVELIKLVNNRVDWNEIGNYFGRTKSSAIGRLDYLKRSGKVGVSQRQVQPVFEPEKVREMAEDVNNDVESSINDFNNTVGSIDNFAAAVQMVKEHGVRCVFRKGNTAIEIMPID